MKLGVLTNLYGQLSLEDTLKKCKALGIQGAEIGCGGDPGKAHCDPEKLLADKQAMDAFVALFQTYDVELMAFACHVNPVHPNKKIAQAGDREIRNAILLAEKVGVDTIVTFSGCPGGCPEDQTPNWATCAWPTDFLQVLDYQWNEVLIPYWRNLGEYALSHGVMKIAFEMHPGFCVYNPETLLKLRAAVGNVIGANFDPSHLIWQGIDPAMAIRELKGAIYHVHAKDTQLNTFNISRNGVLDTKQYTEENDRSWIFRTVGYGNGEDYWRGMISAFRLAGYDKVMSIEHEDSLMTVDEGLEKAVAFLKPLLISQPKPGSISWA
mgnify:FL=1